MVWNIFFSIFPTYQKELRRAFLLHLFKKDDDELEFSILLSKKYDKKLNGDCIDISRPDYHVLTYFIKHFSFYNDLMKKKHLSIFFVTFQTFDTKHVV